MRAVQQRVGGPAIGPEVEAQGLDPREEPLIPERRIRHPDQHAVLGRGRQLESALVDESAARVGREQLADDRGRRGDGLALGVEQQARVGQDRHAVPGRDHEQRARGRVLEGEHLGAECRPP